MYQHPKDQRCFAFSECNNISFHTFYLLIHRLSKKYCTDLLYGLYFGHYNLLGLRQEGCNQWPLTKFTVVISLNSIGVGEATKNTISVGLGYRGTLTKIVFFFSGVLCSFFTFLYLFHCALRDLDLVPHTAMREINLIFLSILVGVFHSSTRLLFLSGLVSFFKGLFNYARPIT